MCDTFFHPTKATFLRKDRCLYCGKALDRSTWTKEHVIGRRFVPAGTLNNEWNVIGFACQRCNGIKSSLEDDISSITLYGAVRLGLIDQEAVSAIQRKSENSISRRTGKPVRESNEKLCARMPLSQGFSISFSMASPPQIDESRAFELARLHMVGFYSMLCRDKEGGSGGFWLGEYSPLMVVHREDWGNLIIRAFADTIMHWDTRLYAVTARGNFRVIIRRAPDLACYAWALEWNQFMRVIGFFGDRSETESIISTFPSLECASVAEGPNYFLRARIEQPIEVTEDHLFAFPESGLNAP